MKFKIEVAAKTVVPLSSVSKVADPAPESTPQENLPVDEFHKRVSLSVLQFEIPVKAVPTTVETEAVPPTSTSISLKFQVNPPEAIEKLASKVAELMISSKSIEFDDTPPEPQENFLFVSSHLSDWVPPSQSVKPEPLN